MFVKVILNTKTLDLNKTFDYKVPQNLKDKVVLGSRVFVPFGKDNSKRDAFVLDIVEESEYATKEILEVLTGELLSESRLTLAKIMSKRYFCNISSAVKLMLNPGYRRAADNIMKELEEKYIIFNYYKKEDIEKYIEDQKKENKNIRLTNNHKLVLDFANEYSDKNKENIIDKKESKDEITNEKLEILEEELIKNIGVSTAILNTMIKNGILTREYRTKVIIVEKENKDLDEKKILTEEQEDAFNKIIKLVKKEEFEEVLLHGITGSGKTEVYLQSIDYVLSLNKTAIVLVPEIGLTPLMLKRFNSRFGRENIAVLHSRLTDRERFEEWIRIENGDAKVVIGTRSAIFAPLENVGIIVIDEEHDASYKSETTPKYHASEIARYFAKTENAILLLGSATPLIESYHKAVNGKIELLELKNRATNAELPEVEIIDLRNYNYFITKELKELLIKNKKNNNQSIIFLNKRGYSRLLICEDCGETISCPKCNINLRYHKDENLLKCHYCGYQTKVPEKCPSCDGELKFVGIGIQQLDEMLKKEIPGLKTIRLDLDSVRAKDSHNTILEEFRNKDIDVLIGTQMVTKGHDFPKVNLSVVILADDMLNIESYRANENTFQTLVQIIGRAGREEENPGKAIIQTYNPDHYIIDLAKKQDYREFYESEIEIRRMLKYPPFTDIIQISIISDSERDAEITSNNLYKLLEQTKIDEEIQIFPAQPNRINRIKNKYIWQIIIKTDLDNQKAFWLDKAVKYIKTSNTTIISLDLNPYSI